MNNWENNPYVMQLLQQQQPQVMPVSGLFSSALQQPQVLPMQPQVLPTQTQLNPIVQQPMNNPYFMDNTRFMPQQGTFTPVGIVNQPFKGFGRFPDYRQQGWDSRQQYQQNRHLYEQQARLNNNPAVLNTVQPTIARRPQILPMA